MVKKSFKCLSVITAVILAGGTLLAGEVSPRDRLLSRIFTQGLEHWHYSGKRIDNDFSKKSFTNFLNYLDPNKQFFVDSDIRELSPFRTMVDDEMSRGSLDFMTRATLRFRQRLKDIQAILVEVGSEPVDLSVKEYIELDGEKRQYCLTMMDLREYWRKLLKYQTLNRYISDLKNKKKPVADAEKKKMMAAARKSALKVYRSMIERLLKANEDDYFARYTNALLQVFDPHTSYFPPKQQVDFEIEMTGKLEGIGALLGEEDGYVKIVSIIPGGPSWKQKKLAPGDLILKVAQGKKDLPVDIVGMRVEDAVRLIRGKKGTLVRLTVKKADNRQEEIEIVRDIVVIEETYARSVVVKDKKHNSSLGYIYLPRFYNDFKTRGGRNSADDVLREIKKLKSAGVSAIVLDLRNNTGGSLIDAIRIAGFFIPKGPMVQVRDRVRGIQALDDPDTQVQYSGPVGVVLNTVSASASEIVAAALQDYRRAVIMGSSHSFGKGTVQQMVDLDRFVQREQKTGEPLGALKLTVQKFYRVNGKSNQYSGVMSDIFVPDLYTHLEIGERYLDFALKGDQVAASSYRPWEEVLPLQKLRTGSRLRVARDSYFTLLKDYVSRVKTVRENTRRTLEINQAVRDREKLNAMIQKLNKFQQKKTGLVFADSKRKKTETSGITREEEARRKDWLENLAKDRVLKECINIMQDFLSIRSAEL